METFQITKEISDLALEYAGRMGVAPDLHSNDHLLAYIMQNNDIEEGIAGYFRGGRDDARKIIGVMESIGVDLTGKKIIDFAAGYGRVVRHLKKFLPETETHASDIHPEACDFMLNRLSVQAHQSAMVPEDLEIGTDYDFICVMSLFSHLPDRTFSRWLVALLDRLAPGGYLLFTTHGQAAIDLHAEYFGTIFDRGKGIGFRPESDQPDIDNGEYGSTVVSMQYILRILEQKAPHARVRLYEAGGWLGIQDGWVIRNAR